MINISNWCQICIGFRTPSCSDAICTCAHQLNKRKPPTKRISYWSFWIHTSVITFVYVFFNHDVFFRKLGHLKSLFFIYIWFHICICNCFLRGFGLISFLVNIRIWFYICICIYIYYVLRTVNRFWLLTNPVTFCNILISVGQPIQNLW